MQYPDSWYITHLNWTLKTHTSLYQYIVNHQMQAMPILALHLPPYPLMNLLLKPFVHSARLLTMPTTRQSMRRITIKPYKQNFKKNSGCGCGGQQTTHGGGCSEGSGCTEGSGCGSGWRGRSSGHGHNPRCYHNWVPCEQFDNLSNEEYQTLICDRVSQGELLAHNADAEMSALTTPPVGSSVSLPQVPVTTPSTPDASSAITGLPTYPAPNVLPCSVSIALVTPSPSFSGVTTSTQMDSGLNTVLQQLMLNASACTPNTHGSAPRRSYFRPCLSY